jgi:hypothetical protein
VQRKPAIKKAGGKVFALDYGRLMGDPIYSFILYSFVTPFIYETRGVKSTSKQ